MLEEGTEAEKELHTMIHLINPNNKKNEHYVPILLDNSNRIFGNAKYRTLGILLESSASYLIVLGNTTTKITSQKDPASQMEHPRR